MDILEEYINSITSARLSDDELALVFGGDSDCTPDKFNFMCGTNGYKCTTPNEECLLNKIDCSTNPPRCIADAGGCPSNGSACPLSA